MKIERSTLPITANNSSVLTSTNLFLKKITKIALPAIALVAVSCLPVVEGGIYSGVLAGGTCVIAGFLWPTSLFWAAAPCYEAAMWATANPLIP